MRFDHWSKEEKQLLEYDYQQLFADQVIMLKKIYRFKSDMSLLNEILENISTILYRLLNEQHLEFVEELLERMFLSVLPYDVIIHKPNRLNHYRFDLYFYDEHQTISYRNITIFSLDDVKKLIELILFIGRTYDQLTLSHQDDIKSINSHQLIRGFDQEFIKNNLKQLHQVFYIQ